MKTISELMERRFLVGSGDGFAIFWNHSATFSVYAVDEAGRAEELNVYTRYAPEGLSEAKKIRWAIFCGREIAEQMKGQEND